jgi:hypothetical protein
MIINSLELTSTSSTVNANKLQNLISEGYQTHFPFVSSFNFTNVKLM